LNSSNPLTFRPIKAAAVSQPKRRIASEREGLPVVAWPILDLRFNAVTGFWPVGGGGDRTFFVRTKKGIGSQKFQAAVRVCH
jgi:hypothetical protein